MSGREARRLAWQAAAAAAVVLLLGSSSAASAPFPTGSGDGDLVASAQTDAHDPTVLDEAAQTTWPRAPGSGAAAVATASATCDGCHARAVTVQVVRADRGWRWSAHTDNVATAWATCQDCTAQAVAVQVVLVRRAALLDVDNRALAVTAECTRCVVNAVAYQLVVQASAAVDPATLQQRLLEWARTQPAAAAAPGSGARTARTRGRDRLTALEGAVRDLVDGPVLRSSVVRRSG